MAIYNPNQDYGYGDITGNNTGNNFLPDPMGLGGNVQAGGPGGFNEADPFNNSDLEMRRRMANKALHSAKTPQARQAAAAQLAGVRGQINQGRMNSNMGYNENRDAGRIAQDVGTPGVKRINPTGAPGMPLSGSPGSPTSGTGGGPGGMFGGMQNNPANNMLSDVYNRATGGTINSFNQSANRLRERLDADALGQSNQARNQSLGRGFGPSGLADAQQFRIQQGKQNNYAQGLDTLSNQFEQNRLQGLNTALGAGTSMREGQEENNRLGFNYANMMNVLLNNREQRGSNESIAGADRSSRDTNAASDRSLQEILAQLNQQNENYRASLNLGDNKIPTQTNIPGLGSSVGGPLGSIDLGSQTLNTNKNSPIYSINGNLGFPSYT